MEINGKTETIKKGKNAVTHTEKQLARYHDVNGIDAPIGVNRQQCGDCRKWFREQAQETGKEQIVADPEYVRIYKTDGTVEIYDADNNLLYVAAKDDQPKATMLKYEDIVW